MDTMVLTSIKVVHVHVIRVVRLMSIVGCSLFQGTPLYMCPELVDEKPYDHTADLWYVNIRRCSMSNIAPLTIERNTIDEFAGRSDVFFMKSIMESLRSSPTMSFN
jgi:hypothetical protein